MNFYVLFDKNKRFMFFLSLNEYFHENAIYMIIEHSYFICFVMTLIHEHFYESYRFWVSTLVYLVWFMKYIWFGFMFFEGSLTSFSKINLTSYLFFNVLWVIHMILLLFQLVSLNHFNWYQFDSIFVYAHILFYIYVCINFTWYTHFHIYLHFMLICTHYMHMNRLVLMILSFIHALPIFMLHFMYMYF